MTLNKGFKKRVRARASKTGESYTAALQHMRNESASAPTSGPGPDHLGRIDPNFLDALAAERIPTPQPIRIAVAQASDEVVVPLEIRRRQGMRPMSRERC